VNTAPAPDTLDVAQPAAPASGLPWWVWAAVACAVALIVVAAGVILVRNRRTPEPEDEQV
jgi:hypothetical protein